MSKINMESLKKIKILILDIDGVLTDGNFFISDGGSFLRRFNALDGYGIKMAIEKGLKIIVISGGSKTQSILLRCKQLGIDDVYVGREDKLNVYFENIKPKYNVHDSEVAYMGDDVYDIPLLLQVGLAVTVPNAHPKVKECVKYITQKRGGEGAVRELIDLIVES